MYFRIHIATHCIPKILNCCANVGERGVHLVKIHGLFSLKSTTINCSKYGGQVSLTHENMKPWFDLGDVKLDRLNNRPSLLFRGTEGKLRIPSLPLGVSYPTHTDCECSVRTVAAGY